MVKPQKKKLSQFEGFFYIFFDRKRKLQQKTQFERIKVVTNYAHPRYFLF